MLVKFVIFIAAALVDLASSAIIKVVAQAEYGTDAPFKFVPNDLTAAVGDVLEFHFAGPGEGVLGGNHSVAQGTFDKACVPASSGFFSGYMPVNATSTEADMVFQVDIISTDPIVFYCTQGEHCTRGMHGVVNGAGDQTLESYRDSITVNRNAVAPDSIGGGTMVVNNISNILPAEPSGMAGSKKMSLASIVAGLGFAIFMSR